MTRELYMGHFCYARAAALAAIFLLQGCVDSQFPLLDEESAIADSSFTGRYDIVISDDKTPMHIVVYLMDKKYLLEQNGKLAFIATLHNWRTGLYLAQLRDVRSQLLTKPNIPSLHSYMYILVKKTNSGADLNLVPCSTGISCTVSDIQGLLNFADLAEQNPREQDSATATKTADLGQSRIHRIVH